MIKTTDINRLKQSTSIPVSELGKLLKEEGFGFSKVASTEDIRVFISQDNNWKVIVNRGLGKIYSTRDNKKPIHMFSVTKA